VTVLLHGSTFYICVDFLATNRCTEKQVTHIYTITSNGEAKNNLFILYSRCCFARGYTLYEGASMYTLFYFYMGDVILYIFLFYSVL
jgi:hypothetical protein